MCLFDTDHDTAILLYHGVWTASFSNNKQKQNAALCVFTAVYCIIISHSQIFLTFVMLCKNSEASVMWIHNHQSILCSVTAWNVLSESYGVWTITLKAISSIQHKLKY